MSGTQLPVCAPTTPLMRRANACRAGAGCSVTFRASSTGRKRTSHSSTSVVGSRLECGTRSIIRRLHTALLELLLVYTFTFTLLGAWIPCSPPQHGCTHQHFPREFDARSEHEGLAHYYDARARVTHGRVQYSPVSAPTPLSPPQFMPTIMGAWAFPAPADSTARVRSSLDTDVDLTIAAGPGHAHTARRARHSESAFTLDSVLRRGRKQASTGTIPFDSSGGGILAAGISDSTTSSREANNNGVIISSPNQMLSLLDSEPPALPEVGAVANVPSVAISDTAVVGTSGGSVAAQILPILPASSISAGSAPSVASVQAFVPAAVGVVAPAAAVAPFRGMRVCAVFAHVLYTRARGHDPHDAPHACTYAHAHPPILHPHIHTHPHTHTHAPTQGHTHPHAPTRTHAPKHTRTHAPTRTHPNHAHARTRTHAHTCTHAPTRTRQRAYTHAPHKLAAHMQMAKHTHAFTTRHTTYLQSSPHP